MNALHFGSPRQSSASWRGAPCSTHSCTSVPGRDPGGGARIAGRGSQRCNTKQSKAMACTDGAAAVRGGRPSKSRGPPLHPPTHPHPPTHTPKPHPHRPLLTPLTRPDGLRAVVAAVGEEPPAGQQAEPEQRRPLGHDGPPRPKGHARALVNESHGVLAGGEGGGECVSVCVCGGGGGDGRHVSREARATGREAGGGGHVVRGWRQGRGAAGRATRGAQRWCSEQQVLAGWCVWGGSVEEWRLSTHMPATAAPAPGTAAGSRPGAAPAAAHPPSPARSRRRRRWHLQHALRRRRPGRS